MNVLKFGGASLGSIEAIENLIEIVRNDSVLALVVSAFPDVTDDLISAAEKAEKRRDYAPLLEKLLERHKAVAFHFLLEADRKKALYEIDTYLAELGESSPRSRAPEGFDEAEPGPGHELR